jgi:hypothetical protein
VLLHERQHAQDAAHAGLAVAAVDRRTEHADGLARARGPGQQRQRRGRRSSGLIGRVDRVAPARVAAMLAEQDPGGGIEQPHVVLVPLDGDHPGAETLLRGVPPSAGRSTRT